MSVTRAMHIAADGTKINYRVDGSAGPWITLIAGITNDLSFWDDQVLAFADRFRVLRYDARGHGASDPAPSGYSVAGLTGDLVGLWDALGIDRSHLVGLGFGGSLAIALAIDQPARVDRLVAVACRDSMTPDFIETWRRRATEAVAGGMAPLVADTVGRWCSEAFAKARPDQLQRLAAMVTTTSVPGYVGHALAFTTIDLAPRLDDLIAPTLFVSGGADPGGGRSEIMADMASRARHARHVSLPGAGHLCTIEAGTEFNEILLAFLA